MILASVEGLASAWILLNGRPDGLDEVERLVAYVQAQTATQIAEWLQTLAQPHTQPAAYYETAARKLRDHEHLRSPKAGEGARNG